jgi:hypothetical protein
MKRLSSVFAVLAIAGLLAVSCSAITGAEDEEEEEQETETVELQVSTDPSEGGSVDPENETFDVGTEVEVTATAADGWEFSQWSGDIESEDNPLTFTIEEDTDLTAEFTETDDEPEPTTYELTASADPSEGGSVDPEGGTFDEGEQVEVTATANDGWEFSGWSGDIDSEENPVTITMDSAITITADFSEIEPTTYELTVNTEPSQGGSVDPEGGTYDEGEEVEVTATPSAGWEFSGWSGDIESSDNPLTVTMDANTTITAEFTEVPTYELTVNANPSEGGSVDPSSGTFDEGEEVEVTATPESGWSFTGWTGDVESSDNPLTITMNSDTDLTANFEEDAKAYANQIEVSDGTYSEVLEFGMDANATAGFDQGLDDEAPPAPPEGSFYGNFVIDNYNLFKDFRPVTRDRTVWELNFSPTSGNNITISWDFSSSNHAGSLSLVDDPDDPSLEIDMETESSYAVTDTSVNTLYIVQE